MKKGEKLIKHLYDIGSIEKVETVTPFGYTLIKGVLNAAIVLCIALIALFWIWGNY